MEYLRTWLPFGGESNSVQASLTGYKIAAICSGCVGRDLDF